LISRHFSDDFCKGGVFCYAISCTLTPL
jgi:hypothetical protein